MTVRHKPAPREFRTRQRRTVPRRLCERGHVVERRGAEGVDREQVQDLLEDLLDEVAWEPLGDARDGFGGGVPDDGVLWVFCEMRWEG